MDVQSITDTELETVGFVDYDATFRACSSWWRCEVVGGAAVAAMDEEGAPATHLVGLLGVKVKRARADCSFVHEVDARVKNVLGGRQRSSAIDALVIRVVSTSTIAGVARRVHGPVILTANEVSCVLEVVIGLSWAVRQGLAACLQTVICCSKACDQREKLKRLHIK